MRRLLDRIVQPLQALAVLLSHGLFGLLTPAAASAAGGWILRRVGPRLRAHAIARRNLERALPDRDADQIVRLLDAMWDNLGRNLGEFPHLRRLVDDPGALELRGMENVEALRRAGRPAVFFGAHLANWEIAPVVALRSGITVDFIYRAPNNRWVDRIIARRRVDPAGRLIPKSKEGGRQALAALKAGRSLGILIDQKMNDGIEARFFGRPAMTTPAFAQLALRFGAPILPVRFERLGGARFRVTVEPPITLEPSGDRAADIAALVQTANDRVEAWVRDRPEQWFWVHRRWREAPAGSITPADGR